MDQSQYVLLYSPRNDWTKAVQKYLRSTKGSKWAKAFFEINVKIRGINFEDGHFPAVSFIFMRTVVSVEGIEIPVFMKCGARIVEDYAFLYKWYKAAGKL